MGLYRNVLNYIRYRKIFKKNYEYFFKNYRLRHDNVYRLYTTINLPINKQQEIRGREYLKLKEYSKENEKENFKVEELVDKYMNYEIDNAMNEMSGNYISNLNSDFRNIDILKYMSPPIISRPDPVNVDIIFKFDRLDIINIVNNTRLFGIIFLLSIPPIYFFFFSFVYIPIILLLLVLILNKIIVGRYIV